MCGGREKGGNYSPRVGELKKKLRRLCAKPKITARNYLSCVLSLVCASLEVVKPRVFYGRKIDRLLVWCDITNILCPPPPPPILCLHLIHLGINIKKLTSRCNVDFSQTESIVLFKSKISTFPCSLCHPSKFVVGL